MRRALAAGCCALALAGCDSGFTGKRGDARKGGSVLVGMAEPPDSLDPALAASSEARRALWLAYTPPMTYRRAEGARGTETIPGVAESEPEVLDGATAFRFRLRKDLAYSDGRPVLAADFRRAVARSVVLNPRARRALGGIRGVEAYAADPSPRRRIAGIVVNERTRTVRIELTAPDPEFPALLTSLWTAPVPPGTATRDLSRSPPAGIGPYRLESGTRGRSYVLTRVRGFRLEGVPAGNVDSVAGTVVPDRRRRTRQTLSGRLDVTQGQPPTEQLPEIRSEFKSRYHEYPTLTLGYVAFDLAAPPFSDEDVRHAVSFSLGLRALSRLEEGFLAPTCNVIPPQVSGYVALDPCPYGARQGDSDLVRAAQLVRGSKERDARVLVDGGDGPHAADLADYGVQTLRKIGLRARRAGTPRERRRAQLRFARVSPRLPAPAPYLELVDDAGVRSDVGALERDDSSTPKAPRWAAIDREVVRGALIAPFGLSTTGVLLSERLDAADCRRFHPVYGLDFSSLCLS